MKKRYLSLQSQSDVLDLIKNAFPPPGKSITVPLLESEGRVASEPLYAQYSVPDATIAEMDGIAVKSSDTTGAGERHPVTITDFARVDTGNVIPSQYDAVLKIEEIQQDGESCITKRAARPGQYIRPAGQDVRRGDLIIPRGHQFRSSDVSAIATYGYDHVTVRAVSVGIIPVGDELVPLGTKPGPGKVVESNSVFADSFLSRMGALCTRYGIVPNDCQKIERSLGQAISHHDLVLISSGTSVGRHDNTAGAITRLGRLIFHGVAMLPGKSAMLGEIDGKPAIGLPGYPVASQTVLRELVAPLLVSWGLAPVPEWILPGRLARDLPSEPGYDEYIPVSVASVNGSAWAFPHPRGSGLQMNLVRANGYLHIPPSEGRWEAGARADIHCTSLPYQIERSLLCVGAKHPGVALLADILADQSLIMHTLDDLPARAVLTLQRDSCNCIALSIPDIDPAPEWFLALRDLHCVSMHIGEMQVGIASRKDAGTVDLSHARLVNSPEGSTGALLLEQYLKSGDIRKDQITGGVREGKTEEAVAAAVRNGSADAGICSFALASDAGLSFVPLRNESHDIVIRKESLDDERVQILVRAIQSPWFKHRLTAQGWYITTRTGQTRDLQNG
jgi:putative molybdopterin biosynthesis protein